MNRTIATSTINETSRRDGFANETAKALMSVNLVPGFMMESSAISTALELVDVPSTVSQPIGWGIALLLASRLLIEKDIHRDTIKRWTRHPLSTDPPDHRGARLTLGGKSFLFGALSTLLFTSIAFISFGDLDWVVRGAFLFFTAVRYLSLFTTIASDRYNESVTDLADRNRYNPTSEQRQSHPSLQGKLSQIFKQTKALKRKIKDEFTAETNANLLRALFGAS